METVQLEFSGKAYFALVKKTGLSYEKLDSVLFESLDPQPEDIGLTLEHYPEEVIWVAACRLSVLNTDIIGIEVHEAE
jgi:lambda repressor-like predicted transcriptional regulator